jgi:UDPglucose 6-dehydrogenase
MNRTQVGKKNYSKKATCITPLRKLGFSSNASISILGSGVVGENVGKGLVNIGNSVVFYDVDIEKVERLKRAGLRASESIESAIMESTISYFCVPTPATDNGRIDLGYIKDVTKKTAQILRDKNDYHLIVVKSTVLPTTTEKVIIPLLEKHSCRKAGKNFGICCNPEFLTEIHDSWIKDESFARGFLNEPCIVIGAFDKKSGDYLQRIYHSLRSPILRTDLKTAEMIKYAFNCALATRISFWNEIFLICRTLGIDSDLVASAASNDPRIGLYGTVHKKAFGGKCLPKDLSAFVHFCAENHSNPKLLSAVLSINEKIAGEFGVRE